MKRFLILMLTAALMVSCHTQKEAVETTTSEPQKPAVSQVASPKVVIYKMKKDYSQHVPVTLSADKKSIVSYPHPRDVYTNGKLAIPTQLVKGYWLDNRGINENVAFLEYTYEEYAQLQDVPSIDILYNKIIDKNPLKEMWICGHRHHFNNIEEELNDAISNNVLEGKFQRVK